MAESNVRIMFCQVCGGGLPNTLQPYALKTKAVKSETHPNKTVLGRIDMVFRCPHCRKALILAQQHFKSLNAANEQALILQKRLEEEGRKLQVVKDASNRQDQQ